MKVLIHYDAANAAFEVPAEHAQVLQRAYDWVRQMLDEGFDVSATMSLLDTNGNTVGQVSLVHDDATDPIAPADGGG